VSATVALEPSGADVVALTESEAGAEAEGPASLVTAAVSSAALSALRAVSCRFTVEVEVGSTTALGSAVGAAALPEAVSAEPPASGAASVAVDGAGALVAATSPVGALGSVAAGAGELVVGSGTTSGAAGGAAGALSTTASVVEGAGAAVAGAAGVSVVVAAGVSVVTVGVSAGRAGCPTLVISVLKVPPPLRPLKDRESPLRLLYSAIPLRRLSGRFLKSAGSDSLGLAPAGQMV
jgi:hypothetical protein